MILCKSPLRISLFGGGTDKIDFLNTYNKSTIFNFTINYYSYVFFSFHKKELFNKNYRISYSLVENLDDKHKIKNNFIRKFITDNKIKNLCVIIRSDIPVGTGLASSSAISCCLQKYINTDHNILKNAIDSYQFEKYFNNEIGIQDHLATSYGGCNFFFLNKDFVKIKREELNLKEKNKFKKIISKNSFLIWTNKSSFSKNELKYVNKENELENISKISANFYKDYLKKGISYDLLNDYLLQSWYYKKNIISNNKSTKKIEEIINSTKYIDSYKILGAGGRGFYFCLTKNKNDAIKELKDHCFIIDNLKVTDTGTSKLII